MTSKRDRKKQQQRRRVQSRASKTTLSDRVVVRKVLEKTAEQSRQRARDCIRRGDLPNRVGELADGARGLALQVIRQSPMDGKHACKAGCAFCCHTAVTVAPPEAFKIAQHLVDNYQEDEVERVRKRLTENAALASGMTRAEYIAKNIPCAMLTDDGNCRVHSVRPLACAGFLSSSKEKCEAEFKHIANREAVPTDKFAMLAGLGVSYGLKDACKEFGLDAEFYELHHAVQRALEAVNGVQRWADGEKVFDGCLT